MPTPVAEAVPTFLLRAWEVEEARAGEQAQLALAMESAAAVATASATCRGAFREAPGCARRE